MKRKETAVLLIGDAHFGRETPDYDAIETLRAFSGVAEKVIGLKRDHLSGYRFDRLVLAYLGDIVDGELIFPDHPFHLSMVVGDQIRELSKRLDQDFHQPLAEEFKRLSILGVPGNHGRPTPRRAVGSPRTNYDLMLYGSWELLYKRDWRISWDFDYKTDILEVVTGQDGKRVCEVNPVREFVNLSLIHISETTRPY